MAIQKGEAELNQPTEHGNPKGNKAILYLAFLIFAALIPFTADAATLYFSPSSGSYTVGQNFSVGVYVSSSDQAMNAAAGEISFPANKLQVISLSKSGSIFNIWVQEPLFSNTSGTVNFEGIVLNPGFKGSSGKLITINFKTKAAGNIPLSFSTGSVLANDGQGTNILSRMTLANYLSQTEIIPPEEYVPPANTPGAPKVSSSTHPDSLKWYSDNDPKFAWDVSEDITGARLLVDKEPIVVSPTVAYSEPITEKQIEDLADGIWYFHVQLRNKNGWGGVAHFKFQIDTQAPELFEINVREGKETTNPQPTLLFGTTDATSGIDYYEIKIDQEPALRAEEEEYKMPLQAFGPHTVIVKAVDKAGNETLTVAEINILAIETPVITDYPKKLTAGNVFSIEGLALPETKVKIYIQRGADSLSSKLATFAASEAAVEEVRSDKHGSWIYIGSDSLEAGRYKIWAEAVDSSGAKSMPSEDITVQVVAPAFLKIGELAIDYLTTIITLSVLVLVIIFGISWMRHKIKERREATRREVTEAEKKLHQVFRSLRKQIEKEVAKLDGKPDLSPSEKEIYNNLKKALKNSEKYIGKEIKDIKKEL